MKKNADYNNTNDNTTNPNTKDNTSAEQVGANFLPPNSEEKKEGDSKPRARAKAAQYKIAEVLEHLDTGQAQFFESIENGALADYREYRLKKDRFWYKDAKSLATMVRQIHEYSNGDASVAQKIVDQSRANGWAGLFRLKNETHAAKNNGAKTTTFSDYDKSNPFFAGVK